jgi:hypothetical protein
MMKAVEREEARKERQEAIRLRRARGVRRLPPHEPAAAVGLAGAARAPRYTPAGLPALDLVLKHESTVSEDGQPRKVSMEMRRWRSGRDHRGPGFDAAGQRGGGSPASWPAVATGAVGCSTSPRSNAVD